jgi:type IV pilus assembly protein PilW
MFMSQLKNAGNIIAENMAIMKKLDTKSLGNHGFTLVELFIAMAVGGFVVAGMYTIQKSQQESCVLQEQVAVAQQNIRASKYMMVRELRMAGFDPTGSADAAITLADSNTISFTADTRGAVFGSNPDGDTNDPNENITYSLFDCDGDGDLDLRRQDPTVVPANAAVPLEQMIAKNIEALDLVYFNGNLSNQIDDDGDGTVDEDDEAVMTTPVAGTNLDDIRSVQLTLVARLERWDDGYVNNTVYSNQQGAVIFSLAVDGVDNNSNGVVDEAGETDSFRRRVLTTNVCCRNLDF